MGDQPVGFIAVVSGLPRSGTSMMMRMIEAGGMRAVVDHDRQPDTDNPNGYYEFEPIKKVKDDASWLPGAVGGVVKAVYLLLYDLPKDYRYRVVLMRRNLQEVIASQNTMLRRSGAAVADINSAVLSRHFQIHLTRVDAWLKQQAHISVLNVDYAATVRDPLTTAQCVAQFLGGPLDSTKMAATVDPALYRQRSG